MNIYSCVDYKNIDKIIILFYSCYINCSKKKDIKFYLLIDEETDYVIPDLFKDILKIKSLDKKFMKDENWYEINSEFSKYFYKQSKCNHIMNFSRFFIFHHFPELNSVIYLDWDMIVQDDIFKLEPSYKLVEDENKFVAAECKNLKNKFENIYNILIEDSNLLVCNKNYNIVLKNKILQRNKIKKTIQNKLKKINNNINLDENTFNAGFFIVNKNLFDLTNLKLLINFLIEIQKEKQIFRFGTQIIMNILINDIIFVDSSWNSQKENSSIIHWKGGKYFKKPWEINNKIWLKYKNEIFSNII